MDLPYKLAIISSLSLVLSACSVFDTRKPASDRQTTRPGGYYKDDGPGANPPANLAAIPDAVPRVEPLHAGASKPYTVFGRDYVPMTDARGFSQEGLASWYGRRYHGNPTSSGEPYDMYAMTAAHTTLPIPSYVRVTNPANGRSVVVRVNDRGPFHEGRVIDLSYTAAWKLDLLKGVTPVRLEAIDPSAPAAPPPAPAPVTPPATATTVMVAPLPPLAPDTAATTTPFLQLGAFSQPAGADDFLRQVRDRLGNSLPSLHRVETGDLIKVQAGPFASPALADQAAALLAREFGVQAFKVWR